jgi:hypothetical protein
MSVESLVDARKRRRNIIEQLQKQQLGDSCCAEKVKHIALDARKRLLKLLAEWLVAFEPGKSLAENDLGAFGKLTLPFSADDWLAVQRQEAELIEDCAKSKEREEEAYRIYHGVARYGIITTIFRGPAEKAKADRLRSEHKLAKERRVSLESALMTKREHIREMIAFFLRGACRNESLGVLAKESHIKDDLLKLINSSQEAAVRVWHPHSDQQLLSLRAIESEVKALSEFYSSGHTAEHNELLGDR